MMLLKSRDIRTYTSPSITNESSSTGAGVASRCVHTPGICVTVMSPSSALIDIWMYSMQYKSVKNVQPQFTAIILSLAPSLDTPLMACYTYIHRESMTQLFVREQRDTSNILTSASPSITTVSISTGTSVASNCVHTPGIFVTIISPSSALVDIWMYSINTKIHKRLQQSFSCPSFSLQLHVFSCHTFPPTSRQ